MNCLIKLVVNCAALFLISACGAGGGATADSSTLPDNSAPIAPTQDVTVTHGSGYSCVLRQGGMLKDSLLYCWGVNVQMQLNTAVPVLYAEGLVTGIQNPALNIKYLNNTLCIETHVVAQPFSSSQGIATYCIGDGNVNGFGFVARPAVFSPPVQASNISAEFTFATMPYAAADDSLINLLGWGAVLDTDSAVSTEVVTCGVVGIGLDCHTFTLTEY